MTAATNNQSLFAKDELDVLEHELAAVSYGPAGYTSIPLRGLHAKLADAIHELRRKLAEAERDATECICKGNWRLIMSECRHLIGQRFMDPKGKEWTFFGLVDGEEDYYYGMTTGENCVLLSCVGSIDGHGFIPIDAARAEQGKG